MSHFKKTIAACAVALMSCTLVANAHADDGQSGGHWQHNQYNQSRHHDGILHDLLKLHAELNLTASQEQQWQAAVAAGKTEHEQQRAAFQQARPELKALMQAPILDLRALQAEHEKIAGQAHQAHAQVTEAWLKVYDSLDATQKKLISTTLKDKWQQHQRFAEHWDKAHHDAAPTQAQ